ncbi:ATP-binding cassette domain-containing protein [Arcobacter roscoffensis]|uniref:ATP-binding cassette domain-containing protein n=1 Tax=Arcobacter roscoffensis TaxID=2961520 RepID=A0ABY5EA06_9BACT|nr:ATP-binding cassette domain-containing protein [Arcobacter roscoffensis]UTJ07616.1 ATP-binding cassette domain-containing protein [Arcobacter roscoffensis]
MIFNLENETISYENKKVLDSINLSIKKGEKIALLGSSGSGKSTLLKRLYEIKSEEVSYLPQDLGLVNNLTSYHNVYTATLEKKSTIYNLINLIRPFKKDLYEVSKILKELECESKLLTKSLNLSGGQKQRVAIAKSIYSGKNILLADEPISALDEYICKKSIDIMHKSFETIICAMHNVDLAIENFDRIIGIKNGKILLDKQTTSISKEDTNRLYYVVE